MVSEAGIHIANPMVLANLGRLGSIPVKCDQLDQYSDHLALLIEKSPTKIDIFISKSKEELNILKQERGGTIVSVKKLISQIRKLKTSENPENIKKLKQICSGNIKLMPPKTPNPEEQTQDTETQSTSNET